MLHCLVNEVNRHISIFAETALPEADKYDIIAKTNAGRKVWTIMIQG